MDDGINKLKLISYPLQESRMMWEYEGMPNDVWIITKDLGDGVIEIANKYTIPSQRGNGLMNKMQSELYTILLGQGYKTIIAFIHGQIRAKFIGILPEAKFPVEDEEFIAALNSMLSPQIEGKYPTITVQHVVFFNQGGQSMYNRNYVGGVRLNLDLTTLSNVKFNLTSFFEKNVEFILRRLSELSSVTEDTIRIDCTELDSEA